ncbi:hypothetical protein KGQ27_03970 [Patescibacteria group bacterium]|nr:hypothetical protein [Patescibacteria group bacterium]MDE2011275.1 hypothetical protein [Patescibacteria group bacterium]MDE2233761.1 hypothetical protein [Patescibacteria group bacterium]
MNHAIIILAVFAVLFLAGLLGSSYELACEASGTRSLKVRNLVGWFLVAWTGALIMLIDTLTTKVPPMN